MPPLVVYPPIWLTLLLLPTRAMIAGAACAKSSPDVVVKSGLTIIPAGGRLRQRGVHEAADVPDAAHQVHARRRTDQLRHRSFFDAESTDTPIGCWLRGVCGFPYGRAGSVENVV